MFLRERLSLYFAEAPELLSGFHVEWSVVLPVKDEIRFLYYSLPSVLKMKPSELVLCLDYDAPEEIEEYALSQCRKYNVILKVLYLRKNKNWKFHQYYVRRCGYLASSFPKIFTFDVDCVLYPDNILVGYDMIGRDNVAFVTFRKKLVYEGLVNSSRSALYDLRRHLPRRRFSVNKEAVPFIGIYWLYKPYYLDLISEDVAKNIYNGEDTLASYMISSQTKYKHIHLDDVVACWSLREGNEDIPWRQEQLGIFLGCNSKRNTAFHARILTLYRLILIVGWKVYPKTMKGFFVGRQYPKQLSEKICSRGFEQMIMHSKYSNGRWFFDYPD